MEKIVEIKICKQCNSRFEITDKDLEFYEKVSPIFPQNWELSSKNWEIRKLIKPLSSKFSALNSFKYLIPSPTLCPDCRTQRRLSWRNETKLYKRNCSLTWKSVVSIYSPDKNFVTYNQDDWWSEKYNPFEYGIDFDFNKTFFEQFSELQKKVPRITILNWFSENADYGNHSYHNKNSYFVNSCWYVEDCIYCLNMTKCKDCIDCEKVNSSEKCYESFNLYSCYNCKYCINCDTCSNLYFCEDCEWTRKCIWCKWLKNNEYFIVNKKVEKDKYKETLEKIQFDIDYRNNFILEYQQLKEETPSKYLKINNSENISYCDDIENSQNLYKCFDCVNSKDLKYCSWLILLESNNCYDYDIWWENSSFIYEVHCLWNGKNILFSNVIWWWYNMIYCDNCLNNSRNCFWCIWLKNNEEYCILNKQYTKEQYEDLVPKIIEHMMSTWEWWEFFPSSLSPFWYNETVAEEYFPLTRAEALWEKVPVPLDGTGTKSWLIFNWSDYEAPKPKVEKIIPANKLPENIRDIPDDILNRAIIPEDVRNDSNRSQQKPFRIIKQELDFYRKNNIAIPRKHPNQRQSDRMKLRSPRKHQERICDKCNKKIISTYSRDKPMIIYCEECYEKQMY